MSDDSRQHDPALQHPLALIEAALTGSAWARTPSTVALIRSLTAIARAHAASRIADILLPSQKLSLVTGESDGKRDGSRMPQAQVA